MSTNASGTEERIDKRTRKAATESMTVIALDEPGEYKVYSGSKNSYVVDVIRGTCECPDSEYNPQFVCKHRQRAEMEIGEREIPDLGGRLDVEIMADRETETTVATDGGAVVDDTPQGETDENGRPDDCECIGEMSDDELGCWPCYRDGFTTANPEAEPEIEAEAEQLVAEMEAAADGGDQ